MNMYQPDEEFIQDLKEWIKENPFNIIREEYGLKKFPSKKFFTGLTHTDEWKKNTSDRMKANNPSHCAKVRAKISATKMGVPCPKPEGYIQPGSIRIQTPLGTFSSCRKAAMAHGISGPTVKIWAEQKSNGFSFCH